MCVRTRSSDARARARSHARAFSPKTISLARAGGAPPSLLGGGGVRRRCVGCRFKSDGESEREREREKSLASSLPLLRLVNHGSHNVSRWMTWLPISLKNAAKCDNWYQLQNHSITESLNAKGAREKLSKSDPRACRISVSNNKSTRNARALLHGGDQRVQSNAGSEKK